VDWNVNAYLPHDGFAWWIALGAIATTLPTAFGITRLPNSRLARWLAWSLLIVAFVAIERSLDGQPPGFRMVAIILVQLFALKGVVSVESHIAGEPRLRPAAWFIFSAGWLGMRPAAFAGVPGPARMGAGRLIRMGIARLLAGAGLIAAARASWVLTSGALDESARLFLATALLLPGISLVLHFGLLNISAGSLRRLGAECHPLFRAPLKSKSLTEFWGRRWNLAFSEMATLAVVRPLRPHIGQKTAMAAAFLFSGLLHETAISVPVQAGYGLPMLYFLLHGVAVLIERRLERAGRPIHRRAWLGRLWTLAWLLLPLPILFHPAFLAGCAWPLIGIDGSR
jgi:hypothetical protein